MSDTGDLKTQLLDEVAAAADLAALDAVRVRALGKQGVITAQLKSLGAMDPEQRKAAGAEINVVKQALMDAIAARKASLEAERLNARLGSERIDVTLPGRDGGRGNLHPVSRALERMTEIFARLGYSMAEGPEIEDDWHNFEALNFPPHHPARAMHDTGSANNSVADAAHLTLSMSHDHSKMDHRLHSGETAEAPKQDKSSCDGNLTGKDCCPMSCGSFLFLADLTDFGQTIATSNHAFSAGSFLSGLSPVQLERPPRT